MIKKLKKYEGLFQEHLVAGDDPHQNHMARRIQSYCQATQIHTQVQTRKTKMLIQKILFREMIEVEAFSFTLSLRENDSGPPGKSLVWSTYILFAA